MVYLVIYRDEIIAVFDGEVDATEMAKEKNREYGCYLEDGNPLFKVSGYRINEPYSEIWVDEYLYVPQRLDDGSEDV